MHGRKNRTKAYTSDHTILGRQKDIATINIAFRNSVIPHTDSSTPTDKKKHTVKLMFFMGSEMQQLEINNGV